MTKYKQAGASQKIIFQPGCKLEQLEQMHLQLGCKLEHCKIVCSTLAGWSIDKNVCSRTQERIERTQGEHRLLAKGRRGQTKSLDRKHVKAKGEQGTGSQRKDKRRSKHWWRGDERQTTGDAMI